MSGDHGFVTTLQVKKKYLYNFLCLGDQVKRNNASKTQKTYLSKKTFQSSLLSAHQFVKAEAAVSVLFSLCSIPFFHDPDPDDYYLGLGDM